MSDEFNPIAERDLMDEYVNFLSNLPEEDFNNGLACKAFFAGAKAVMYIVKDIEPKTEEEIKQLFVELDMDLPEF